MRAARQAILRSRSRSTDRDGEGPREYQPGEEVRSIHWPASARRGSIQVRQRARGVTLTWAAIIDTSASMHAGRKRSLSEAASEAAEFWRACAAPGDRWIDVDRVGHCGLASGLERALRILPPDGALLAVADVFELSKVPAVLLRIAARRFDCTALVARDPWRDDFPLSGYIVVADLETGEKRRLFASHRERLKFMGSAQAREAETLAVLRRAAWRAESFDESDGARAVMRAFGKR